MASDQLTPEELRQRRLAEEMGDLEFEGYLGASMGPLGRQAIDADRASLVPAAEPMPIRMPLGGEQEYSDVGELRGFYLPRGEVVPSQRERYRNQEEAGAELEADMVYAGSGENAINALWGHEFRHRDAPNMSEGTVRVWDFFRAEGSDQADAMQLLAQHQGMEPVEVKDLIGELAPKMIDQEARAAMNQEIAVPGLPESPYDEVGKMEAYREFYTQRALYRHPWLADYGLE